MELFLSILVYVAVLFLTDPSTALPHNPPHNYLGRPRDKRCPAVSEGQLLCPQHARSCSLAKLDGCDHDGMYCCEDKCNNAICYNRDGTALHSVYYRPYDYNRDSLRPYDDHIVGTSSSQSQYNGRQDNSHDTKSPRNERKLRNFG